ncbi:MAG: FAD-dependent oxidoreductase [Candidatus Nezhaarchaeales archaeon]
MFVGGVSKANTGIIHPGHEEDPRVHPLRAKLCVEGNKLWRKWSSLMNIHFEERGELMIFITPEERKEALKYVDLARLNDVPGVYMLEGREVLLLEKNVSPNVLGAVYAKTAGVISPFEATIALVENAVANGARLLVNTEVERIVVKNGVVRGVKTKRGFIEGDVVVNAAGLYSDKLAHTAGVELDFEIKPRRGQYLLFEKEAEPKPRTILHTTPPNQRSLRRNNSSRKSPSRTHSRGFGL